LNRTAAHRNVADSAFTADFTVRESNREVYRRPLVHALFFIDSHVSHSALKKAETLSTELAREWINIKQAEQTLSNSFAANPSDVFGATFWANRIGHETTPFF
jgi:hypothetical protein